jgi:hypothetical protein
MAAISGIMENQVKKTVHIITLALLLLGTGLVAKEVASDVPSKPKPVPTQPQPDDPGPEDPVCPPNCIHLR